MGAPRLTRHQPEHDFVAGVTGQRQHGGGPSTRKLSNSRDGSDHVFRPLQRSGHVQVADSQHTSDCITQQPRFVGAPLCRRVRSTTTGSRAIHASSNLASYRRCAVRRLLIE
jgi:hypothetical protein